MSNVILVGEILLFFLVICYTIHFAIRWIRNHTSLTFQTIFYALCIGGLLVFIIWKDQNLKYDKKDLVEITSTVKSIEFKFFKRDQYLEIILEDRSVRFHNPFNYGGLKKDEFQSEVRVGDTVTIGYPKREWYSCFKWLEEGTGTINFLELHTREKVYIPLDSSNVDLQNNYRSIYAFWVLLLGIFIYWFIRRKRGEEPWPDSRKG